MPTNVQTGTLSAQTLDGIDGANNTNIIYGDAKNLKNKTVGGDDIITGGDDGAINYIYGDAYRMEGKSKGGADFLVGGANGATNYIFGDSYSMKGKVVGGNDLLVGVNGSKNFIYGDSYIMRDGAKGGDDECRDRVIAARLGLFSALRGCRYRARFDQTSGPKMRPGRPGRPPVHRGQARGPQDGGRAAVRAGGTD